MRRRRLLLLLLVACRRSPSHAGAGTSIELTWSDPELSAADADAKIPRDALLRIRGVAHVTTSARAGEATATVWLRADRGADPLKVLAEVAGAAPDAHLEAQPAAAPGWRVKLQSDIEDLDAQFARNVVRPRAEALPGVLRVTTCGGGEPIVRVRVDPERLAAYHLSMPQLVEMLQGAGANIPAGSIAMGQRQVAIRAYDSGDVNLASIPIGQGHLGDVAAVELGLLAEPCPDHGVHVDVLTRSRDARDSLATLGREAPSGLRLAVEPQPVFSELAITGPSADAALALLRAVPGGEITLDRDVPVGAPAGELQHGNDRAAIYVIAGWATPPPVPPIQTFDGAPARLVRFAPPSGTDVAQVIAKVRQAEPTVAITSWRTP
jgi:hypothetical protein